MTAHRYWMLTFNSSLGTYTAVNEIELRESVSGPDVTGSGTASSPDNLVSGYPASQAFDNNTASTSSWLVLMSSTQAPYTRLLYDFGSGVTKDIVEVAYQVPTLGTGFSSLAYCPNGIGLWYSDDGISWTLKWWLGANDMPAWAANTQYAFTATAWDGTNSGGYTDKVAAMVREPHDTYPTNVLSGYIGGNSPAPGMARTPHPHRGWMSYRWLPNSGAGHIAGSTTSLGVPIPRTVYLIDQRSGAVLDRVDTHYPTGCVYQFDNLDLSRTYTVLGVDRTTSQNDVVYAHVSPVE